MSVLSNAIEEFIKEMLSYGETELQRNELAQRFGCAPSQINYVLTTRFSLDRGYIITSRRGGGGYIKITRIKLDKDGCLLELVMRLADKPITGKEAKGMLAQLYELGAISAREAALMFAALETLSNAAGAEGDAVRSEAMRAMLTALMGQNTGHESGL